MSPPPLHCARVVTSRRSQTLRARLGRTEELTMLVAGDIGGTKTDLAIYSIESGPRVPLAETEVHSADYPSLQAAVADFLADVKLSVDVGSFAVAGPVIAGHAKTTNLPWGVG